MYKNNITKNQSGFTLVEMLVSIAVFMSVLTVAVSSLVSIINVNRKTQEIKNVVDNVTFVIDSISRNVRIGTNYNCSIDVGGTYIGDYSNDDRCKNFQYQKSANEYVQYQFVANPAVGEGNIQRRTCSGNNSGCPTWQSMTAPTDIVKITNMTFYVIGAGTENLGAAARKQPRLIITVEGVIIESNGTKTSFSLQTTASQRSRQSNG